ncbi:MAG: ribose-phosphate pyrophosphokinase [Oceanospirillales bacterium]|uniref:ribose-phosphate diphosphokinase n=1 Tax=Marinobacterium halophilum TaxID=267374 RepID=A0A2P8EYX6_9GAMM|nr:ribose-phosphate pyrophosphokinase [Marinobacterium halophilum]MBR9828887.1 ribose-phosphate pyrophosphokinase [Oceanospirillales bacterium]PSL14672.1 ribose-phosphate pyrophosphokinase [Marinobacterium halophilum]
MLLFNPDSDPALASQLTRLLDAQAGILEQRRFPDGESYLRVHSDCAGQDCVILCNLFHPDERTLRLLFLADTLRECGARSVGLVTPYLAYMRQDKRFHPGECVSSRPFARLLSAAFDYLVTVDPHLHRYDSLDEIYSISSRVVPAAPLIARWIQTHITHPLLIGPDSESEQWVSQVAELAGAPFQVLQKERRGDYDVSVSLPDLEDAAQRTPVLVDDIISSGRTMLETIKHLQAAGLPRPVAIGVHGIFAGDAYSQLTEVADVVTTACIPHLSNQIDIAEPIAEAVQELLAHHDTD